MIREELCNSSGKKKNIDRRKEKTRASEMKTHYEEKKEKQKERKRA